MKELINTLPERILKDGKRLYLYISKNMGIWFVGYGILIEENDSINTKIESKWSETDTDLENCIRRILHKISKN